MHIDLRPQPPIEAGVARIADDAGHGVPHTLAIVVRQLQATAHSGAAGPRRSRHSLVYPDARRVQRWPNGVTFEDWNTERLEVTGRNHAIVGNDLVAWLRPRLSFWSNRQQVLA